MNPVEDERLARITWSRLAEPEDPVAWALIDRLGLQEALDLVLHGSRRASSRAVARFAARLQRWDLQQDLAMTDRAGARVLIPGDAEWPEPLAQLERPPWCLWVRGPANLAALAPRSASVVGSRAATEYGVSVAGDLAAGLGDRGFAVVSGAAFGIDAAAHRGALGSGITTVAVLACGVERAYPSAHSGLLREIGETGAIVSELPPATSAMKMRFIHRNRLIAALTRGTVVVEAGLRSGALSTGRMAARVGRPVGAVPGPVTSTESAGCHEAVRQGWATLVTETAEVVELVGAIGTDLADRKQGPVEPVDELGAMARRVWSALPPRASRQVEDLARLAGLAEHEVLAGLGELDGAGLVEQRLDGWGKGGAR